MAEKETLSVSATEVSEQLNSRFGLTVPSNMISKELMQHGIELQGYGVTFELRRSHGKRWIELSYDPSGDSGAGLMLCPISSCPAGTREVANPLDASSEPGDGRASGDGSGCSGDGSEQMTFKISLEDVIHRSAARVRQRIYEERGIAVPELHSAQNGAVCPPFSASDE